MVRWPAAAPAADFGRAHPELSLGLHLDLGEWAFRDEEWVPAYEVVATDNAAAVTDEVARQLELFRTLVGRNPTHIDSHQHVHRSEPVRSILLQVCRTLDIPLRHFSAVRYCGDFYGQTATGLPYPEGLEAGRLIETLAALPSGITELGCHPGLGDDVDSMYCTERAQEQETLCDPRIRESLTTAGIELRSFRDFDWRTGPGERHVNG
jgi:predicted glycoside hydrolase/deacetylase ChbG (UPF0249 family)